MEVLLEQSRFTRRLAIVSPIALGASYVAAQLLLRGAAALAPRFATLTVIGSIAMLLLLIGLVAYLRDENLCEAGALLALVESVSHFTTDIASDILNGRSIGVVVATLPRAFLEMLGRMGVLAAALIMLVWLLRRIQWRDAPAV
jgi:hypothetical protein